MINNKTKMRVIYYLIAALTIIVVTVACSSTDEPQSNCARSETSEFSALISDVGSYSMEFLATHSVPTRGLLGIDKFFNAIKADHIGITITPASYELWSDIPAYQR